MGFSGWLVIKDDGFNDGESEVKIRILNHSREAPVTAGNSTVNGGAGSQKELQDLTVSFEPGSFSSKLLAYFASRKSISTVIFLSEREDPEGQFTPFENIELTNVIVASFKRGSDASGTSAIDTIKLNFEKADHKI